MLKWASEVFKNYFFKPNSTAMMTALLRSCGRSRPAVQVLTRPLPKRGLVQRLSHD